MKRLEPMGSFSFEHPLQLHRADNDGWIVRQTVSPMHESRFVGAFTTAEDMLASLADALGAAND